MLTITVLWFGPLGERCGCGEERVSTAAASIQALWDEMALRHDLPGRAALGVMAAVGDEMAGWNRPLAEGDAVAFLPLVSGG